MICLDRLKEITFLSRCPNEEKLLPDMLLTFYMSNIFCCEPENNLYYLLCKCTRKTPFKFSFVTFSLWLTGSIQMKALSCWYSLDLNFGSRSFVIQFNVNYSTCKSKLATKRYTEIDKSIKKIGWKSEINLAVILNQTTNCFG